MAFTACCSGDRLSLSLRAPLAKLHFSPTCLISLLLYLVLNGKESKLQQISAARYLHFMWTNAATGADGCCGETGSAAHKTKHVYLAFDITVTKVSEYFLTILEKPK